MKGRMRLQGKATSKNSPGQRLQGSWSHDYAEAIVDTLLEGSFAYGCEMSGGDRRKTQRLRAMGAALERRAAASGIVGAGQVNAMKVGALANTSPLQAN